MKLMKLSFRRLTLCLTPRLLHRLKGRMRWVRAAGCVVSDPEGNILLIRRNGRWDLPKGKVEAGETLCQAALRETLEETGIHVHLADTRLAPLKTYHIYNLYGGWHLKQTSWFAARCADVKPLGQAQHEEGITGVVWVSPDEWRRRLRRSYGTMRILSRSRLAAGA